MNPLVRLVMVLFLLAPIAARAETVGLRSGEHDGFTRIVVQFRGREDWVFGRVDGGFELRAGRADIEYRLDRVFEKIRRSRIGDIRDLGNGRLFLAVDCNCHGSVFELSDGQVVVDIVSGPAREPGNGADAILPPVGQGQRDRTEEETGGAAGDISTGEGGHVPVIVSDRAGLPLTLPRTGTELVIPHRSPQTPSAPSSETNRDEPVTITEGIPGSEGASDPELSPGRVRDSRVSQTETVLLEQIARAAAQGLLDADMRKLEQSMAGTRPEVVSEPPPPVIAPPRPPAIPRGHISVETGVDRAASAQGAGVVQTNGGDACIDPKLFDISDWGGDIENGTDIGVYRSSIIGEFDIESGDGLTALARNYVYIGFGAEAKALIRRYGDKIERPDLLFAMAEIMDFGESSTAAEFVDQMACAGATALWATLAQPELAPGQGINRDAVVQEFGALPAHLRRHLGPGLANDFLTAGDRETAELIRAAIDRAGDPSTSEYGMLAARLDLDDGEVEKATETLDGVAASGDEMLPEALLQRVEATLSVGGAVPEDIIVLLDSLVVQYRGTETARLLADAGVRARASSAEFAAAFAQLDAASDAGLLPPERSAQLRQHVFERLTKDADDVQFLRLTLPRLSQVSSAKTPLRLGVASRLLDLGLPEAARVALGGSDGMPQPEERILLARAALQEERPAAAIGYLAGLTDPGAVSLRADAMDMARDHLGAVQAHREAAEREDMLRSAWRGGLWEEVAKLDQGPLGSAALLMAGHGAVEEDGGATAGATVGEEISAPDRPGEERDALPSGLNSRGDDRPTLAAAQALIEASRATRQTLDSLLAVVPPPAPADSGAEAAGVLGN